MPVFEELQQQWRLLCMQSPKGFEKFFKRGKQNSKNFFLIIVIVTIVIITIT